MRKLNLQMFLSGFMLLSAASMLVLSGCAKDGNDGKDGIDGKDAIATCKECHNPTVVDRVVTEFQLSKHSYGLAAGEEAGSTSCGPCHEQEGFKFVCKENTPTAFVAPVPPSTSWTNPYATTPSTSFGALGCKTCHSSLHTTYGYSDISALTTTAPVSMTMWGGAKTINLTQKGGKSNLCAKCHQPRPFTNSNGDKNVLNYAKLVTNPTDTFYSATQANSLNVLKPSYRTHTHYGTAGAIFAGQGGIEFGTGYANSTHTTVASCQDCHMAPITGATGGHSFKVTGNFNGCNVVGCHSDNPVSSSSTSKWLSPRNAVKALLNTLASKLKINGVDILNRNGDSESNLWIGLTTNNYDGYLNIFDPVTNPSVQTYNATSFQYIGTPNAATWSAAQIAYNATLPKITLTNAQMGAIINFQLCLREYSLGIHNTEYTKTLLTNTIAMLP